MHITLMGGSADDGVKVFISWREDIPLPPYVCNGEPAMPFQHFVRIAATKTYLYAGECITQPHPHGVPHSHEGDDW